MIGVILLNYCNYELTIDCINSIRKSTERNIKIYVIDNASPDDSGKKFCCVEDIVFIQLDENIGFAGGNNVGIKSAIKDGCDFVMLLNNDTIISETMIEMLKKKASPNTVTVPKMFYFDVNGEKDILWYAGGEIKYKSADGLHLGGGKKDGKNFSIEKPVTFATGCCMMIHKDIIERVGLLREEYFMYCEDTDFSIRLNKEKIEILYVPTAELWHKVSSSSGGEMSKFIIYYIVRNKIYCAMVNRLGVDTYVYIILETLYRSMKAYMGRYYLSYQKAPKALLDGIMRKMGKRMSNIELERK